MNVNANITNTNTNTNNTTYSAETAALVAAFKAKQKEEAEAKEAARRAKEAEAKAQRDAAPQIYDEATGQMRPKTRKELQAEAYAAIYEAASPEERRRLDAKAELTKRKRALNALSKTCKHAMAALSNYEQEMIEFNLKMDDADDADQKTELLKDHLKAIEVILNTETPDDLRAKRDEAVKARDDFQAELDLWKTQNKDLLAPKPKAKAKAKRTLKALSSGTVDGQLVYDVELPDGKRIKMVELVLNQ